MSNDVNEFVDEDGEMEQLEAAMASGQDWVPSEPSQPEQEAHLAHNDEPSQEEDSPQPNSESDSGDEEPAVEAAEDDDQDYEDENDNDPPVGDPPTDEPPLETSPRAEKRIQQLSSRAKAAEQEAAELRALMAQFVQSQMATSATQKEVYDFQRSQIAQQQSEAYQAQMRQQLEAAGWNFAIPEHRIMLQQQETMMKLQQQFEAAKRENEEARMQANVAKWQNGIDNELRRSLHGFDVTDSTISGLAQQALELAAAAGLPSPKEAVERVLHPVRSYLPKKGDAQARAQAARAIATSSPSAMKITSAGVKSTARIKAPTQSIDDLESELGSGGDSF